MMALRTKIILLALCLSFYCKAQQIGVSIHGGYNQTSISGNSIADKSINAWNAGVGGMYELNKHIGVLAELNYDLKGAQGLISKYNAYGNKILSYNQTLQLHYLTLPVMAQFLVGSDRFNVFVNAGVYNGYLARAWVNPQDKGISHDVTSDFKRNDFGLAGGVGIQFQLNNHYGISLEWRNQYGLTNISSIANNQYNRINSFQFGVNYKFLPKTE
jgi:opacity protein-like surface antigen